MRKEKMITRTVTRAIVTVLGVYTQQAELANQSCIIPEPKKNADEEWYLKQASAILDVPGEFKCVSVSDVTIEEKLYRVSLKGFMAACDLEAEETGDMDEMED